MGRSLNLALTDELRAFVNENSGEGTLFSTPSEFVRHLLREKKERMEAARIRDAILEGYQDAIQGHLTPWRGKMQDILAKKVQD
jgi:antitoxin ParD1/3/4